MIGSKDLRGCWMLVNEVAPQTSENMNGKLCEQLRER